MKIASEHPGQRFLELLIGERIAERIDWTVHVAQIIRDHEEELKNNSFKGIVRFLQNNSRIKTNFKSRIIMALVTEGHNRGHHVEGRPEDDERAEDYGDCAECFTSTVLRF